MPVTHQGFIPTKDEKRKYALALTILVENGSFNTDVCAHGLTLPTPDDEPVDYEF